MDHWSDSEESERIVENGCGIRMGGFMSYFRNLFGSKEMRILILGLDGAGKTTLLYRLQVIFGKSFVIF